jgi:adenylate cyclase
VNRLLGIADLSDDDEDLRLRKRAAVGAAYAILLTSLAWAGSYLILPDVQRHLATSAVFVAIQVANLVLLARTRRFERFVYVLLTAGMVIVLFGHVILGGLQNTGGSLIWIAILPVAITTLLGPERAGPWMGITFVAIVGALGYELVTRPVTTVPPSASLVLAGINLIGAGAVVFGMVRYAHVQLRAARARADALLTNAIPPDIALRLKRGEHRIADAYPETTVLFADLVGFTSYAAGTAPDRVVAMLDAIFTAFDAHAEACGMVKIKTIGDAYMAVAGAPRPDADHARTALLLAVAMQREVSEHSDHRDHGVAQLRVGLASGPVVGGVIGHERISFDLWGDTVNLASRMESTGLPARIQVSASTRELLKDQYSFKPREVEVKGMGRLTGYLLEA